MTLADQLIQEGRQEDGNAAKGFDGGVGLSSLSGGRGGALVAGDG